MKLVGMCKALPMALMFFLMLALGCAAAETKGVKTKSITAIEKTINVLKWLWDQNDASKLKEQLVFTKYKRFYEGLKNKLDESIAENQAKEASLSAQVDALDANIGQLGTKITQAEQEITRLEGEITSADATRVSEREHHSTEEGELSQALWQLGKAITIMKEQPKKRAQGSEILNQLAKSPHMSEKAKSTFNAFLAVLGDDDGDDTTENATEKEYDGPRPPEAQGYEFQSGAIVDMLVNLRASFRHNKETAIKEEMDKQYAYDLLIMGLKEQIEVQKRLLTDLNGQKASDTEMKEKLSSMLTSIISERQADQATLNAQTESYTTKLGAYNANLAIRNEENDAIKNCMDVLEGEIVAAGKQHFQIYLGKPALAQFMAKSKMAMLAEKSIRRQVIAFVQQEAGALKSDALALLATKLREDPYAKIKQLIRDMLEKLEQEAYEDKRHHEWCQREIKKSAIERNALTEKIEGLTAKIDNLEVILNGLEERIEMLTKEISDLNTRKNDAIAQWILDKKALELAIEQTDNATNAISDALQILEDFYARQGFALPPVPAPVSANSTNATNATNATLVQVHKQPEYAGAEYVGNSDGVSAVALMTVLKKDFNTMQARLRQQMVDDTAAHQALLSELGINIAAEESAKGLSEQAHTASSNEHQLLSGERSEAETTLQAKETWFSKVQSDCVPTPLTLEEKIEMRTAEVKSLKKALEMLRNSHITEREDSLYGEES